MVTALETEDMGGDCSRRHWNETAADWRGHRFGPRGRAPFARPMLRGQHPAVFRLRKDILHREQTPGLESLADHQDGRKRQSRPAFLDRDYDSGGNEHRSAVVHVILHPRRSRLYVAILG